MIRHILANSPENPRPRHEVEFDGASIGLLIDLIAPAIIRATKEFPTDGTPPTRGFGRILARTFNWPPEGWANLLQVNAALLRTLADGHLSEEEPLNVLNNPARRELVADALSAFQNWKNGFCAHQQSIRGPTDERFGVCSPFFTQDWSETIGQLL